MRLLRRAGRNVEPFDLTALDLFAAGKRVCFAPLGRGNAHRPSAAPAADVARYVRLRVDAATAILAAVVVAIAVLAVVAVLKRHVRAAPRAAAFLLARIVTRGEANLGVLPVC